MCLMLAGGEILLAMPKASGGDRKSEKIKIPTSEEFDSTPTPQPKPIETKQEAAQKLGFNKQQVERFQTLAQHTTRNCEIHHVVKQR